MDLDIICKWLDNLIKQNISDFDNSLFFEEGKKHLLGFSVALEVDMEVLNNEFPKELILAFIVNQIYSMPFDLAGFRVRPTYISKGADPNTIIIDYDLIEPIEIRNIRGKEEISDKISKLFHQVKDARFLGPTIITNWNEENEKSLHEE
jgi:hypothetical protein